MIDWKVVLVSFVSCLCFDALVQHNYYVIPKSEYNELTQEGKVWAYVRKDVKP